MGVKWPLMQQSLAELMQAYPSAFNRDVQRAITCFTGRAAEMRALGRAEIAEYRVGCLVGYERVATVVQ